MTNYLTCPACDKTALPAQADFVQVIPMLGTETHMSTCESCGSTRTIKRVKNGVVVKERAS